MNISQAVEVKVSDRWPIKISPHRTDIKWNIWEKERLEHMRQYIKFGDVVFDIGSEEGDLSAVYASWGANVIPFEPDPYVWPNFRFVWEANGFRTPMAYFVGFAANQTILDPKEIEPAFAIKSKDGWPGCAFGEMITNHGFRNETERSHDTPSITIADFYIFSGIIPKMITIDVEGAEYEVLKGAWYILFAFRPFVYVSLHPDFITDKYDYTACELFDFMLGLQYEPEFIIYDHEYHWFFHPSNKKARIN